MAEDKMIFLSWTDSTKYKNKIKTTILYTKLHPSKQTTRANSQPGHQNSFTNDSTIIQNREESKRKEAGNRTERETEFKRKKREKERNPKPQITHIGRLFRISWGFCPLQADMCTGLLPRSAGQPRP